MVIELSYRYLNLWQTIRFTIYIYLILWPIFKIWKLWLFLFWLLGFTKWCRFWVLFLLLLNVYVLKNVWLYIKITKKHHLLFFAIFQKIYFFFQPLGKTILLRWLFNIDKHTSLTIFRRIFTINIRFFVLILRRDLTEK